MIPSNIVIPDKYREQARELYKSIVEDAYANLVKAHRQWEALQPIINELSIPVPHDYVFQSLFNQDVEKLRQQANERIEKLKNLNFIFNNKDLQIIDKDELEIENVTRLFSTENATFYAVNWSWLDKIKFVIKREGRPMLASEINDEIYRFEPNFSKPKLRNSVNSTLSQAAMKGRIVKIESKGDSYYDLLVEEKEKDQ